MIGVVVMRKISSLIISFLLILSDSYACTNGKYVEVTLDGETYNTTVSAFCNAACPDLSKNNTSDELAIVGNGLLVGVGLLTAATTLKYAPGIWEKTISPSYSFIHNYFNKFSSESMGNRRSIIFNNGCILS